MANKDPIEMIWEVYEVGRPAGTHFSKATASLLAFRDGTNELQTHATIGRRVGPYMPGRSKVALVAAGVVVGAAGAASAVMAAPKVKVWRDRRRAHRLLGDLPVDAFCHEVDVALDEGTVMSSAEAERRLLEIMLAAAIIAKQMRALSDARIEASATPELRRAMGRLTVPDLSDAINRMFEGDASLLDDERAGAFLELYGGGRTNEGEFLPLRDANITGALRLTQPEGD